MHFGGWRNGFQSTRFHRRVGQAVRAQDIAVGLDRGEEDLAAKRRADFTYAVRSVGPARQQAGADRPNVVDLSVIADEEHVLPIAEARRVLDRRVG